jgi:hypothetical protein
VFQKEIYSGIPNVGSLVVKALGYNWKVVGSRPDEVKFLIYLILPAALGPEVHSASNRNEYRER